MRFESRSRSFDLSPESIDEASEWLAECQLELGVEKADRVRARLLFEEALINFAEHFGEECKAEAFVEKRWKQCRLRLIVEGERYNPTRREGADPDSLSQSLFSIIEMHAQYSYAMGANIVRIPLPIPTMNPVLKILIAIAVGALVGALGDVLIPVTAKTMVTDTVLDPIAQMWIRLLQAISGPVIFFTALTAAFGTKRISDYGGSRLMTLVRYFIISAIVVVFTMVCCNQLFHFDIAATAANRESVSTILARILDIVPDNLLEPFFTADTPQLLLIAIVAGYALGSIGNQTRELQKVIQQINTLGLVITERTCAFVPYFAGLLLCLNIWAHDVGLFRMILIPLVVAVAVSCVVFVAAVLRVSITMHVSPILLLRKLKGPFFNALKTGTLDYKSIDKLAEPSENLLGINGTFARAILPQRLVLYMPTSAVGISVFVLLVAQEQQLNIDLIWLLTAAGLAVVLAVATPPLNGANLLAFVVAFTNLGISSDAFLDVMVFDIVFGVACIAFDQAMLQLETVLQADRLGFLDEKVLRAPIDQC